MKAALAVLVVALAAAVLAEGTPPARADGDPASDFLVVQNVFIPSDARIPTPLQQQLSGLMLAAKRSGYPIKVALIDSTYDLGSLTALWHKPRAYARFLGEELSFLYRGRLLIVMPNGFGFNDPGHPAGKEAEILARLRVLPGGAGLARSAISAVERLAAAAGVKVAPHRIAAPPSQTNHARIVIIATVGGLLALAGLASFGVRRSRRPAGQPKAPRRGR
ncbi:MAG TPA: hypothetical protein VF002_01480 [Gaiellaceae bacterium]